VNNDGHSFKAIRLLRAEKETRAMRSDSISLIHYSNFAPEDSFKCVEQSACRSRFSVNEVQA